MSGSHTLTRDQQLAEAKFLRAYPCRYNAPAAEFYATLNARAQKGREARKLLWRTWLLTPIERS